jgi:fatty acid desaturase
MRRIFFSVGLAALLVFLLVLGFIGLIVYGVVKLIILFPIIILIIAALVLLQFIRGKIIIRGFKAEHDSKHKAIDKNTIDVKYKVK